MPLSVGQSNEETNLAILGTKYSAATNCIGDFTIPGRDCSKKKMSKNGAVQKPDRLIKSVREQKDKKDTEQQQNAQKTLNSSSV